MDEQVKPCELPCPKCGNADILRLFYARNSELKNREYDKAPYAGFTPRGWQSYATRDVITNHCRCCQYGWTSKPLAKPKKARSVHSAGESNG